MQLCLLIGVIGLSLRNKRSKQFVMLYGAIAIRFYSALAAFPEDAQPRSAGGTCRVHPCCPLTVPHLGSQKPTCAEARPAPWMTHVCRSAGCCQGGREASPHRGLCPS